MNAKKYSVYFYLFISIIMGVAAQILMKYGMESIGHINHLFSIKIIYMFLNVFVLSGIISYLISMFFWINVLSKIDLSAAYPFVSIGIILTVLLAAVMLSETITIQRWIGIFIIILGVYIIVSTHKTNK
ncbi:MAG: EamA family transporter [bacterium]